MSKVKDFFKSPHIQIALATGACIIILAYFSKRILPEPIGYLPLAIPPFLAMLFESLMSRKKETNKIKAWHVITVIFLSTALVILLNL